MNSSDLENQVYYDSYTPVSDSVGQKAKKKNLIIVGSSILALLIIIVVIFILISGGDHATNKVPKQPQNANKL